MPDYSWPPMDKRRQIGRPINRLDGLEKSTGKAKYNSDVKPPEMLYAVLLTSPHAHARVRSIDTSQAEKTEGVTAVRVIAPAGTEIQWAAAEVAVVAATREEVARDAVRKIKVDYEVLPHMVREEDLAKVSTRAKAAGEAVTGEPEKGFKESDVVSEGHYAIPVITHCCLEPHGQTIAWKGDTIEYWPSTQGVSTVGGDLAKGLQLPATQVHLHMDHIGGGFGSKFAADRWGLECAQLSKMSGGKPVKLFLDRATELTIAGVRPSFFANIKVGAKKDGTLVAWQSESWATGGTGGGGVNADLLPYVYRQVPHRRINHSTVSLNAGGARAWRAPNHPQLSYLTCSAFEDLAAKLNMDPLEFFLKNASSTIRPETYTSQLNKAAELIEWKKNWHPRGAGGSGHMRRGLGIGVNTWQGVGHNSRCKTTINPDGSVVVELGTQDLGVGNRTVIAQVAAETFGLQPGSIKLNIGDNQYPASGPSGGSTTVGGVCSSTRKSTVNALQKLFEAVAPGMGVQADQLEAVDGRIQVKGNSSKSLTWQAACQKLGVSSISEMGENEQKAAVKEGLNTAGASGVQMADVSVDIETGLVKMNKLVAVQDCGLVVNPKTAASQVYGACIMSVCAALMEERVMDQQTGRVLNADMEFYKLAGIGDIGEIVVHMDIAPVHDKRGIVGLGEPPAIGGVAAIANAVANAIGVRVPMVPLTPDRVIAALERRSA